MRRSLSFKLVSAIVLIEVVMLSILIWDNVTTLRHTALHQLESSAKNIVQQFSATAARFVYEGNNARLP